MEDDKKGAVTQTEENTEGTVTETEQNSGSEGGKKSSPKETKTFSQEEVNALLKKERKKMPSNEELKAFKEWQEAQKSDEQKKSEQDIEYQKALAEKEDLMKENLVFKKGVLNPEDVEFLVFKISKMEGDFEDNLDEFLKEHPNYLKAENKDEEDDTEQQKETTGVKVNNGSVKPTNGVEAILKSRHPELFKD